MIALASFRSAVGSLLGGIAAFGLGCETLAAAPALPVPVPYGSFEDVPYRWVGVVRTDSVGADPTVLGTGWTAGERVVVSAAHVFFVDDFLGWNRNRWFWRRAARPEDFWHTETAQRPRAFRVLSGYASAVGRMREDTTAFYDALNRDTIALLFYGQVIGAPPPQRVVNGLEGTGTFSIVGYPARIAGQPSEALARLYAHVDGLPATFERWDDRTVDFMGNPFELFRTSDLQSGPGGSGGPVFRRSGDVWETAGVLIAGATDYSSVIARSIDTQADALIAQAITDSADTSAGLVMRESDQLCYSRAPICRADGSIVFIAPNYRVRAIDATGALLWEAQTGAWYGPDLMERADGSILVSDLTKMELLDGGTGEHLWTQLVGTPGTEFAIGPVGEIYTAYAHNGTVARISSRGQTQWTVTLPVIHPNYNVSMGPTVGADGTVYVGTNERVYALAPHDGAVRWTSDRLPLLSGYLLALAPDGGVLALCGDTVNMLEPDGSLRWSTSIAGVGIQAAVVGADGTVYVPSGVTNTIHVLGLDGVRRREVPMPLAGLSSFAVDATGTTYVASFYGIEATNAAGDQLWMNDEIGGTLSLAAGNRLVVVGPGGVGLTVLRASAGRAEGTWDRGNGGPDNARRAAHGTPVAPYFLTTPADKHIVEGYRLELEAEAEGSYPITFEWRRNGALLPDQVGQRLLIRKTIATDAGNYTVTVRNLAGEVTSSPAAITVAAADFGDLLWTTNLRLKSAAAIADDGTIYAVVAQENPPTFMLRFYLVALNASGDELWRYDFGVTFSSDTHYPLSRPVIGDDGEIYVGSPGKLWCFEPTGTLRWKRDLPSDNSPGEVDLALGPGRTIYALVDHFLRLFDNQGNLGWELEGWFYPGSSLRVRRDGVALVGNLRVRPDGTVAAPAPWSYGVLGPNDEFTGYEQNTGVRTWTKDGAILATNTAAHPQNDPGIMLENLDLIASGSSLHVMPYKGQGAIVLPPTNGFVFFLAALEGNRILARKDETIYVYQHTGAELDSFVLPTSTLRDLAPYGAATIGPAGQMITGKFLSAYAVKWPLATSPWPTARADARNTNRAPGTFALTRDLVFRIALEGPSTGFAGYATTLQSHVLGAAGDLRWLKNGVPIPERHSEVLHFETTKMEDAGDYTLEVTTAAGTFTSGAFHLTVATPAPTPSGQFSGLWQSTPGGPYQPFVMNVGSDHRFSLLITGSDGRDVRGQLGADGSFAIAGAPPITGTVANGQLTITSGAASDIRHLHAPATGIAPNGIRAGIYRGRALGPTAWPGSAIVLADGTIALTPAWANGAASTVFTSFAGASRTLQVKDNPAAGYSPAFTLSADPTGVLRGTHSDNQPNRPEFTLFSVERALTERLANISTRGHVSPTRPPMIVGFVVQGNGPHRLLLRGAGPGLALVGVQQPLPWPRVRLRDQSGLELRQNDGWSSGTNASEIQQTGQRLGAFPFAPNSKDSALLQDLTPGLYTMGVESVDGAAGIALVEAYEDSNTSGSRLVNLSTRGNISIGEHSLIGGFVIEGIEPKTMLIRVAGPALRQFFDSSIAVASNPRFEVYRQGFSYPLALNDDWDNTPVPDVADVASRMGAFPFAAGSLDAALIISLPPGIYTAVATNPGTEGVGLLELYEVAP